MKIKTLITISLSILFTLVLTLGIITVPTNAVLADQIAQVPTQVITPTADRETTKTLKKEAKKLEKSAKKPKEESIPPITATPAQCTCDCGHGPFSGNRTPGGRCVCLIGCPRNF